MMKKTLTAIAVILAFAFIVIQFIRPDLTNPPVEQAQTLEASTAVPENVRLILARSCADCHTNNTAFPWYAKIQPSAWFLADHIREGRAELNFSVWNTYASNRKRKKLDEMCQQVTEREMPLPSYLWIHRDAQMTDDDVKTLCGWAEAEREKIPATN
jgi:hypothetical protein